MLSAALGSGEARGFFLPGIYVDAAYALVLAASVVVGRPLIGAVWGLVFRGHGGRRSDPRLRRRFAVATLGWSLVYATRAVAQAVIAYQMFEENGDPAPADEVGSLIASEQPASRTDEPTDSSATGSVTVSK